MCAVVLSVGEAKASFLMDHGRDGPPGLLGGSPGAVNEITVSQAGVVSSPPHLSKGEGYVLAPGDYRQNAGRRRVWARCGA